MAEGQEGGAPSLQSQGAALGTMAGAPREADELPAVGIFRLGLGLAQGLALYYLSHQSDSGGWPATNPYLFAPLVALVSIVPVFVLQAAGRMSRRTLALWTLAVVVAVAGLAWYDRYRVAVVLAPSGAGFGARSGPFDFGTAGLSPSFTFMFFTFAGLFIAHSLISAGDADSSFVTRYRNYFDATWKFGLQLTLAVAFGVAFWLLLHLGAALFELIKLDFLSKLIEHDWFYMPAMSVTFAAGIHLTDVRVGLVTGVRTVALTLLSWLLPLMALLGLGFVGSLPFTGLNPLWQTKSAAAILLISAAVLVILVNAAYQDGEASNRRPLVLRYSELIASALLIPLVALAAYALSLRVQQYGWTVERIATFACVLIASCYALGYTAAALFSLLGGQWMWALESVNVFIAFLILAVLGALFTPLADPARLSVLSQVSRLEAGTIAPAAFDFSYLKNEGGRYGQLALQRLATIQTGPSAGEIRKAAKLALGAPGSEISRPFAANSHQVTGAELASTVTLRPQGTRLPDSFLKQVWNSNDAPFTGCGEQKALDCDVFLMDVDGGGTADIVLVRTSNQETTPDRFVAGEFLKLGPDGKWGPDGGLTGTICAADLSALKAGQYQLLPPPAPYRDIVVGKSRINVIGSAKPEPALKCPG